MIQYKSATLSPNCKICSTFFYRGADMSLARPTSRCILFDGQNISFDATLFIYINSTNILPIMIINRIYETQNLLSLQLASFLVGLRTYQHPSNVCVAYGSYPLWWVTNCAYWTLHRSCAVLKFRLYHREIQKTEERQSSTDYTYCKCVLCYRVFLLGL